MIGQHLNGSVKMHKPGRPRSELVESERFKSFSYEELIAGDKTNLERLWMDDDSLAEAADLPAPDVFAQEIIEELDAAQGEFNANAQSLAELKGEHGDTD